MMKEMWCLKFRGDLLKIEVTSGSESIAIVEWTDCVGVDEGKRAERSEWDGVERERCSVETLV